MALSESDIELIARAAYAEDTQNTINQIGHVHVIKLRMDDGRWPSSARGVLGQKNQFEVMTNPTGVANMRALAGEDLEIMKQMVRDVFNGTIPDPTGGSYMFGNAVTMGERGSGASHTRAGATVTYGKHTFYGGNSQDIVELNPELVAKYAISGTSPNAVVDSTVYSSENPNVVNSSASGSSAQQEAGNRFDEMSRILGHEGVNNPNDMMMILMMLLLVAAVMTGDEETIEQAFAMFHDFATSVNPLTGQPYMSNEQYAGVASSVRQHAGIGEGDATPHVSGTQNVEAAVDEYFEQALSRVPPPTIAEQKVGLMRHLMNKGFAEHGGENRGEIVRWSCFADGKAYQWCAGFMDRVEDEVHERNGLPPMTRGGNDTGRLGSPYYMNLGKQHGAWRAGNNGGTNVGDFIIFPSSSANSGFHVGRVSQVDAQGRVTHYISGNDNDRIRELPLRRAVHGTVDNDALSVALGSTKELGQTLNPAFVMAQQEQIAEARVAASEGERTLILDFGHFSPAQGESVGTSAAGVNETNVIAPAFEAIMAEAKAKGWNVIDVRREPEALDGTLTLQDRVAIQNRYEGVYLSVHADASNRSGAHIVYNQAGNTVDEDRRFAAALAEGMSANGVKLARGSDGPGVGHANRTDFKSTGRDIQGDPSVYLEMGALSKATTNTRGPDFDLLVNGQNNGYFERLAEGVVAGLDQYRPTREVVHRETEAARIKELQNIIMTTEVVEALAAAKSDEVKALGQTLKNMDVEGNGDGHIQPEELDTLTGEELYSLASALEQVDTAEEVKVAGITIEDDGDVQLNDVHSQVDTLKEAAAEVAKEKKAAAGQAQ